MSTLVCPECHAQFISIGGRTKRSRSEQNNFSVADIGTLGEGESFWRRFDFGDSLAPLAMTVIESSLILLQCTAIELGWRWPFQVAIGSGIVMYTRLIWPHIKFDTSVFLMKSKDAQEQEQPKKQKKHQIQATVKNETTGYVGYLDYEVDDWGAMITFCKAVTSKVGNFSEAEAARHGVGADDWQGLIDEFKSLRYIWPETIGKGRTMKPNKRGLAHIRTIAASPTL